MLQLFDYQEAVLTSLRKGIADGHRVQMLVAPTGAGKTEMAMSLLMAASSRGNRAAMLLDRIVLCDQTSQRLDKYKVPHGVMQSGHWRYRPYENIQVCSAQTIEKRGAFPGLKLLIVDEAHQTRRQTITFIKNNPDVKVVGLSATPFTKGLGQIYTNVVSCVSTEELVEKKRLVPLRVFVAKEIDMAGAKKVAGEWAQDEVTERGMKITGDIVAEWIKKTHEFFGGPRKTVVFCSGVAHGADLAQKFEAAGYNFVSLSYKDDDEYKKQAVADFSRPDTQIHGLIATDILTKGFDVPDVMIGISARPFSKSLSSHIQQMGRVMRCHPGKDFALWLCMARGSRVLTDRGLVPIEKVSLSDKIWDGTNFVSHKGAVCNGIQKVITYQGLTATPGHLVHTAEGWRTFGECASEQIRITQAGFGRQAIRISEDLRPACFLARRTPAAIRSCAVRMRDMRLSVADFVKQLGRRKNKGLSCLQPAYAGLSDVAIQQGSSNASQMLKQKLRGISGLWWAWGRVSFFWSEIRDGVDHGKPWNTGTLWGCGKIKNSTGQDRPERALRAGESALDFSEPKPAQQARKSVCCAASQIQAGASRNQLLGQHAQTVFLERDDDSASDREIQQAVHETEREVWDILDAGPNNRFTCEGLLVHNCHSGNYLRFRDDWDDVFSNGVTELDDGREKTKLEPTEKEKKDAKCPQCSHVWPSGVDTCPHCGHVRVRQNTVSSVPGEMEELSGATKGKSDKATKQLWYSELLAYAKWKNYQPGWVAHKYKEKFGVWPKGLSDELRPTSIAVTNWLRSRQIAYAKGVAK